MPQIKLGQVEPNGYIGFTYDACEAEDSVGPDEFKKLVPIVILRYHEISEFVTDASISIDTERELVKISPGGKL